jgi:hypothetical protein
MPPDTNCGPSVAGCWLRLGGRKPAKDGRRDEVAASLTALWEHPGQQVFTIREVYAEMLGAGTRYAESTVFKTMQRMKGPAGRPPWVRRWLLAIDPDIASLRPDVSGKCWKSLKMMC